MAGDYLIRQALALDGSAIDALLAACGLPLSGTARCSADGFAVGISGSRVIGVAGIEVHGAHGLLRSVAVEPGWRGRSVGRGLVADRVAWARAAGLDSVYLLTLGAAGYFARLGFVRVDRDLLPDEIRASDEFATLCPKTAIPMLKRLREQERGPG